MSQQTAIKEEEIRPDDLFSKFMDLSAEDAKNFFDRSEFVEIDCPGCGSTDDDQGFEKFGFYYKHCLHCGTLYASTRPTSENLLRYYAESESQRFWSNVLLKKTGIKRSESISLPALERVEGIIKDMCVRVPKRILDVGAAKGAFLSEWKKRYPDAELIAIEPGEDSAQACREAGITVYENFVEDEAENGEAQGDLVTCFEVFEHVQDPRRFTKAIYEVTAPGGIAILSCLGVEGFDIQLLWGKSRSVIPPYHLNFLSKKGIKNIFSESGFSEVKVITPGRLDVEIVQKSIKRGIVPELSCFEKLLLNSGEEALVAFQKFLAEYGMSSHVWIICQKS